MSKKRRIGPKAVLERRVVSSLLDEMKDGREYQSLVGCAPHDLDLSAEMRRALSDLSRARNRPVICYLANVLRMSGDPISIDWSDDLPFSEMVAAVPSHHREIDVVVVTPGGLAQQVSQFVNRLRPRFDRVSFVLPHMTMSAGTLWALSGDEIWMDERAFIGPIDPQVKGRDGRLLPAQAILALVGEIQRVGKAALDSQQQPPWTYVQLLKNMDAKEIGDAITQSRYVVQLASSFLEQYKFSATNWPIHQDGRPVTDQERRDRAFEVAGMLADHERWKMHSHGITRDVAFQEVKLRIGHPETLPDFHRALRRLWALIYWCFESTQMTKLFCSNEFMLFRARKEAPK